MVAKLMGDLTHEEIGVYRTSELYQNIVLASYRFTDLSIEYYFEFYNLKNFNKSIVVFDHGVPVVVMYAYSGPEFFTHFDVAIPTFEVELKDAHRKYAAYGALVKKLTSMLSAENYSTIKFFDNRFLLSAFYSKLSVTDVQYNAVIDLNLSMQEIKSNFRKSFKSLVNWGERNFEIVVLDKNNQDYEKWEQYRQFHIEVAGRETRNKKTWDLHFESIKNNEGFVVLGYINNEMVAGNVVMHGIKTAYYGVGVYNRKMMEENVPLSHYIVYYSIAHAQKIGLKIFDLGFYRTDMSTDDKQISIFKFKQGFASEIVSQNYYTCKLN